MPLIQLILGLIVLGILYVRMIRREEPQRIGKKQAIVPVLLGIASVPLSFAFFIGLGLVCASVGFRPAGLPPSVGTSLLRAFLNAALPEEFARLLVILLAFRLFRPQNVYEGILLGAAAGSGFTLFENFLYGGQMHRLLFIAGHTSFGILMAGHIGLARYNRLRQSGPVGSRYALAFGLPALWHMIYDAGSIYNPAAQEGAEGAAAGLTEAGEMAAVILGALVVAASAVLQIVVLVRVKKKAKAACEMSLRADAGSSSDAG